MSRKISLTLFVIFSTPTIIANTLSLKDAVLEFSKSPIIEKAESQKEAARWKRVGSLSGFLPEVNLKAYHLFHQKYVYADVQLGGAAVSVPSLVPATDYVLQFVMPVFDGFQNVNRYKASSYNEQSTNKDLEWTSFKGSRDVALQFYRALGAKTLKEMAVQNLKALEDHLNDVKVFKAAGISTKFDLLRVEVQKSEAETEVLSASDNEDTALLRLGELLGKEGEIRTLVGDLPELSKELLTKLELQNFERADLTSMREKLNALEELDSAESKYLFPKINLFGDYQKYNNRNYDLTGASSFRNAYSIGVNLTWNLFDGMKSISKDKIAFEEKVQLQKSIRLYEIKTKTDLEFWKKKFNYFVDVYKARKNDISKSEESVRLAKEGRKVGIRTNTDLLDAEAELYRSKAQSVNAKLGAIEALINLELSTGKQLYQFE